MTSKRDPGVTSKIMASVRSKDTKPEIAVRRALWARGYRYRVHFDGLPGKPDIVFTRARLAVFIDGDFWHGNTWRIRGLNSLEELFPTRTEWWVNKIRGNIERDEEVNRLLRELGWTVLRVWESDVERNLDQVVKRMTVQVDQS